MKIAILLEKIHSKCQFNHHDRKGKKKRKKDQRSGRKKRRGSRRRCHVIIAREIPWNSHSISRESPASGLHDPTPRWLSPRTRIEEAGPISRRTNRWTWGRRGSGRWGHSRPYFLNFRSSAALATHPGSVAANVRRQEGGRKDFEKMNMYKFKYLGYRPGRVGHCSWHSHFVNTCI